jgi:AcrR family transcriptional regulator
MAPVNPKRRYDSPRRAEQARQTRASVVEAARRLFLRGGFAATTIAAIAAQAQVSVETIYKAFGGKPGLVRAICATALTGEGPVPAETRSDELQAQEPDPRKIIRGWGKLTTEVAPRIAPILLLIRSAAATDPEMAALRAEMDTSRLTRMTSNARNLADAGHLRDDITAEHAGEVLWTYSSPELYELLVLGRGWPAERYATFIADAMIAALLPPEPPLPPAGTPQRPPPGPPVDLTQTRASDPRATHENTRVMRRSRNPTGPGSISEPSSNAAAPSWTTPDRFDRAAACQSRIRTDSDRPLAEPAF